MSAVAESGACGEVDVDMGITVDWLRQAIDWVNTNNGFSLVILTLVYSVATCVMVSQMRNGNRHSMKSLQQLREIEANRTRPYLAFGVERRGDMAVAIIRNSGLRSAHNISIRQEERLQKLTGTAAEPSSLTASTISQISPGQSLEEHLGLAVEVGAANPQCTLSGTIEYCDASGKEFTEEVGLDLSLLGESGGPESQQIVDALSNLRDEVRNIAAKIGGC